MPLPGRPPASREREQAAHVARRRETPLAGIQHRRALQAPLAQIRERFIGCGERIAHDMGVNSDLRGERQKFARILAREIGDRDEPALLPQQRIGEAGMSLI